MAKFSPLELVFWIMFAHQIQFSEQDLRLLQREDLNCRNLAVRYTEPRQLITPNLVFILF